MAKLADIAAVAGVSVATVSRVINRRPGVRDVVRARVLAAMVELPYAPRGLDRFVGTGVFGLLIPELSNPVFPAFAEVLETTAADAGYSSLLCGTHASSLGEERCVRMLVARGVRGVVFVSPAAADTAASHSHYRQLLAEGVRMVFVNGYAPVLDVPDLRIDLRVAGYTATRHLIELGHRRIGVVSGPSESLATRMICDGWRIATEEAGIDTSPELVAHSTFGVDGGIVAMARLLDTIGPSGVICCSDHMALGAISEARRRGCRVPEDLSVVGFDNMPLAPYCAPPLTTLAQPIEQMAQAAINELITLLNSDATYAEGAHSKVFRPRLVVRQSTAPPDRR